MRTSRSIALIATAVLAGAVLSGCASGSSNAVPPTMVAPGSPTNATKGTLTIRVTIPEKTVSSASASRRPRYISPSTTQLFINIEQGGASIAGYPKTVPLTQTSPGCSSAGTTTTCVLNVPLPPGAYTLTLTALDAGNVALSAAQLVPFTIKQDQANQILVTLNGIPHFIQIQTASPNVSGTQLTGFTFFVTTPQTFSAFAQDADGNLIVGPGSPTFSVSSVRTSGAPFTVTQPTIFVPNMFTIRAPQGTASATLFVTARFTDATCTLAGAVCTGTATLLTQSGG